MKSMSQRQQRVAESIRHILAPALLRADVPTVPPLGSSVLQRLSVVAVWASPDLRQARVYLDIPHEWNADEILAALDVQVAAPLRKLLSQQLTGKTAPSLTFHPESES